MHQIPYAQSTTGWTVATSIADDGETGVPGRNDNRMGWDERVAQLLRFVGGVWWRTGRQYADGSQFGRVVTVAGHQVQGAGDVQECGEYRLCLKMKKSQY